MTGTRNDERDGRVFVFRRRAHQTDGRNERTNTNIHEKTQHRTARHTHMRHSENSDYDWRGVRDHHNKPYTTRTHSHTHGEAGANETIVCACSHVH